MIHSYLFLSHLNASFFHPTPAPTPLSRTFVGSVSFYIQESSSHTPSLLPACTSPTSSYPQTTFLLRFLSSTNTSYAPPQRSTTFSIWPPPSPNSTSTFLSFLCSSTTTYTHPFIFPWPSLALSLSVSSMLSPPPSLLFFPHTPRLFCFCFLLSFRILLLIFRPLFAMS